MAQATTDASEESQTPASSAPRVRSPSDAIVDMGRSVARLNIALRLAWQDATLPFRRSFAGVLWVPVLPAVWASVICLIFIETLGANSNLYIAYVFAGVVLFSLFQAVLVAGTDAFTRSSNIIRNIPGPLFVHVLRAVFRPCITALLQAPLIVLAFIVARAVPTVSIILFLPALALTVFAVTGYALALACAATIIRDLAHAVQAIMRIAFFATPVFWYADQLGGLRGLVAALNPLAWLLQLSRDPLLGAWPPMWLWGQVFLFGVIGWLAGLLAFSWVRTRIVAYL